MSWNINTAIWIFLYSYGLNKKTPNIILSLKLSVAKFNNYNQLQRFHWKGRKFKLKGNGMKFLFLKNVVGKSVLCKSFSTEEQNNALDLHTFHIITRQRVLHTRGGGGV